MENSIGLAYVGRIIKLEPIPNADFIECATVICGKGGKWKGIVRKGEFLVNAECIVFLPDAVLNEVDHADLSFMKDSNWRVKMRRFRGAPSEVLITKHYPETINRPVGYDVTELLKVRKYFKPVPANLQGKAKGEFPSFIPKTDEPNYQRSEELVQALVGKPFFITEKADGSSTTAFKYQGNFGICSRHWELERDPENGYWKVAINHKLEERLPDGFAIQWETCGPKIQGNPMGFTDVIGLAFSAYNITEKRYLNHSEFVYFCTELQFPMVPILKVDEKFCAENIEKLGEGTYKNGKQREGVVIRSMINELGHKPISFKVINLSYEK